MTRKTTAVPRRHFLRGAGALLAIPVLESLYSRQARAAMVPQKRILFMIQDNGNLRDEWAPQRGSALNLPYMLAPLEPVKQHINVLGGIDNHLALFHRGNGHDIANSTLLTCLARSDGQDANGNWIDIGSGTNAGGPSIDQVIASALPATPRKSVNIDMPGGVFSISYTNRNSPAGSIGLDGAFDDLFANFMGTTDPALQAKRKKTKESIIDAVMDNFRHVNNRVSIDDKKKLDQHVSTLRDLETRLALEAQGATCDLGNRPLLVNGKSRSEVLAYTYALAFGCGLTNVGICGMTSPDYLDTFAVKYAGGYHNWIHQGPDYGLDPVRKREDWRSTMKWYAQEFALVVNKFQNTIDINGSLLDNSVIVWTNVFGAGFNHDYFEIPVVLAGGAGGSIQGGRFLDYRNSRASNPSVSGNTRYVNQTTNNLCLSLARAMGVGLTSFGTPAYSSDGLPGLVT
jgi:Protein of unknown function (DUF1552)